MNVADPKVWVLTAVAKQVPGEPSGVQNHGRTHTDTNAHSAGAGQSCRKWPKAEIQS
jgi:hypothetical protein